MTWTLVLFGLFYLNFTSAIDSCAKCPEEQSCLLESSRMAAPGKEQIEITICKYDPAKQYDVQFFPEALLTCDQDNQLAIEQQQISPTTDCQVGQTCTMLVTLTAAIDPALVLQGRDRANTLAAALVGINNERVPVAKLEYETQPIVPPISISHCSPKLQFFSSSVSRVEACNIARVCVADESASSCSKSLNESAPVKTVECPEFAGGCTMEIELGETFACDIGSKDERFIAIEFGGRPLTSIARVEVLAPKINDIIGLEAGTSKLEVRGENLCDTSVTINFDVSILIPDNDTSIARIRSDWESMSVEFDPLLDYAYSGSTILTRIGVCGMASETFSRTLSDASPEISRVNRTLRAGAQLRTRVKGSRFSRLRDRMKAQLSVPSSSDATSALPSVSIDPDSPTEFTISSQEKIDLSLVGKEVWVTVELSPEGTRSEPQYLGVVCDDEQVLCDAEFGEDATSDDSTSSGRSSAGISGGLIASLGIIFAAVVGLIVELRVFRRRHQRNIASNPLPSRLRNFSTV